MLQTFCQNLLKNATSQYSKKNESFDEVISLSTTSYSITSPKTIHSDDSKNAISLLHQALKRKRNDSENKSFKRKPLLFSNASHHLLNAPQITGVQQNSFRTDILKNCLLSTSTTSKVSSIFQIIPTTSKPVTLATTHVELASLLTSDISKTNGSVKDLQKFHGEENF
jgi:hypothetical protein